MNDFEWMDVEICWKSQFPRHHFGQIYLHSVIALLTKSWVVLRTFELLMQIRSNWCQLPSDWANLNISYIEEMSRCLTLQRKSGGEADAALAKIGSNLCQVIFCQRANPDITASTEVWASHFVVLVVVYFFMFCGNKTLVKLVSGTSPSLGS